MSSTSGDDNKNQHLQIQSYDQPHPQPPQPPPPQPQQYFPQYSWPPYMPPPPQLPYSFGHHYANQSFRWEHILTVLVVLALFFTVLYYKMGLASWFDPCRNVKCAESEKCVGGKCVKDSGNKRDDDDDGGGGSGSGGDGDGGGGTKKPLCPEGEVPFMGMCIGKEYKCHNQGALSVLIIYMLFLAVVAAIMSKAPNSKYIKWVYVMYCVLISGHLISLMNDMSIIPWDKAKHCSELIVVWVIVNALTMLVFATGLGISRPINTDFVFFLAVPHLFVLFWIYVETCVCDRIQGTDEQCIFPYCPDSDPISGFWWPFLAIFAVPMIGATLTAFFGMGMENQEKEGVKSNQKPGNAASSMNQSLLSGGTEQNPQTVDTGAGTHDGSAANTQDNPKAKSLKEQAKMKFVNAFPLADVPLPEMFDENILKFGSRIIGEYDGHAFTVSYDHNNRPVRVIIHDLEGPSADALPNMDGYKDFFGNI